MPIGTDTLADTRRPLPADVALPDDRLSLSDLSAVLVREVRGTRTMCVPLVKVLRSIRNTPQGVGHPTAHRLLLPHELAQLADELEILVRVAGGPGSVALLNWIAEHPRDLESVGRVDPDFVRATVLPSRAHALDENRGYLCWLLNTIEDRVIHNFSPQRTRATQAAIADRIAELIEEQEADAELPIEGYFTPRGPSGHYAVGPS